MLCLGRRVYKSDTNLMDVLQLLHKAIEIIQPIIRGYITPLVINTLGVEHTHTNTHIQTHRSPHRNNFKKPSACCPVRGVRLV